MIIVEELTYQNFLKCGNSPITIKFNEHTATLVTGTNGTGKSTMLDALDFCLFNKPFRTANKGQLVNSVNGKNMKVEVKLNVDGVPIRVVRGAKPNLFEIYQNGKLLNQEAAMKDYQTILEQQILKLNYKTFNNVAILGAASFIPFMQLPAASRREVIEDILDIKVFSAMNVLMKKKAAETKAAISQLEVDIRTAEAKVESQSKLIDVHGTRIKELQASYEGLEETRKSLLEEREAARLKDIEQLDARLVDVAGKRVQFLSEVEDRRASLIQKYDDEMGKNSIQIEYHSAKAASIRTQMEVVKSQIVKLQEAEAALTAARGMRVKISTTVEGLEEQASFFRDNTTCPSCEQGIEDGHKTTVLANFDSKIEEKKGKLPSLESAIGKLEGQVKQLKVLEKDLACLASDARLDDAKVKELTSRNAVLTSNRNDEESRVPSTSSFDDEEKTLLKKRFIADDMIVNTWDFDTKLKMASDQMEAAVVAMGKEEGVWDDARKIHGDLTAKRNELLVRRQLEDVALALLKDTGIKTAIIHEYLPTINTLINQYLSAMDFYVQFELTESFEEVIKSRHRDQFTYSLFSEGEKRRIDLAIHFTWRQIAKMKNSVDTNLMILDEVLDGSLDAAGIDFFFSIMAQDKNSTNFFVISHRDIIEGFDSHLKFTKKGDFSVVSS